MASWAHTKHELWLHTIAGILGNSIFQDTVQKRRKGGWLLTEHRPEEKMF